MSQPDMSSTLILCLQLSAETSHGEFSSGLEFGMTVDIKSQMLPSSVS